MPLSLYYIKKVQIIFALIALLGAPGISRAQVVQFTEGPPGTSAGNLVAGDYDNDGDSDLLIVGIESRYYDYDEFGFPIERYHAGAKVYRNDLGVFTDINAGLTGLYLSSAAWGDYDGDGDLDILITGSNPDTVYTYSIVYRNNGDDTFTEINSGLSGVTWSGSVEWGDYDNDGDLDVVLTGEESDSRFKTKVFQNNGNGTFAERASLTGVQGGDAAWGDYDNDGDLDIALTGSAWGGGLVYYPISTLYRNNGNGSFSNINAGFTALSNSSVAWGDFDNDGNLDVVLSGRSNNVTVTELYHNNGDGTFTKIDAGLDSPAGFAVPGDFDNDGDLDLIVSYAVYENNGDGSFTKLDGRTTGGSKNYIDWADVDGDGNLEIATNPYETGPIRFFRVGLTLGERAAKLAKSLAELHPEYIWGGKGWDALRSRYIDPNEIISGYIYPYWDEKNNVTWLQYGTGVDCSGLVVWAYNKAWAQKTGMHFAPASMNGMNPIPYEGAKGQYLHCVETFQPGDKELKPGDIIFLDNHPQDKDPVDHVMLYLGKNDIGESMVANAKSTMDGVLFEPGDKYINSNAFISFGRPNNPKVDFRLTVYCPVDLVVSDPEGYTIDSDSWVIGESEAYRGVGDELYYSEGDVNGDGDVDDVVYSPTLKNGTYNILVVPEVGADPTRTYTLEVEGNDNGDSILLAKDVPIANIPSTGYQVLVTDGEIVTPGGVDAPRITLNGSADMTAECGSAFTDPGAIASDVNGDPVPVVTGGDIVDAGALGDYVVTYNATDSAGNPATEVTRVVHVVDTTAPTIVCISMSLEPVGPEGNIVEYAPMATDTCGGGVVVVCDPPSGTTFAVGSTTEVTCTAADGSGNQVECSFSVHILSVQEVLDELVLRVEGLKGDGIINHGIAEAFSKHLRNIRRSVDDNKLNAACSQIEAFIQQVQNQVESGKLGVPYANQLVRSATNIHVALDCWGQGQAFYCGQGHGLEPRRDARPAFGRYIKKGGDRATPFVDF